MEKVETGQAAWSLESLSEFSFGDALKHLRTDSQSSVGLKPNLSDEDLKSNEDSKAALRALKVQIEEQEQELQKRAQQEGMLRREIDRLQTDCLRARREKEVLRNAWQKAQAENQALSAELAQVKAQQHKLKMKADNKANNLQCKIDSLLYAAKEADKKHEASLREMQERLDRLETRRGAQPDEAPQQAIHA
mmetsp:Transcript_5990/g.14518  ORF Transcript_5990/g.14518 Transcript_5990/m.14518 type:complete len:192 (+) Transcript_5990:552-1127(+)|eukprot:CAMPEP_0177600686 /NCGR_PEP_ID=MMETSP0419_2-20121207/13807_1 /TAXON_ID=582737 /ORGANISM="Tetraselmis sp., Strain GSL018" /LENGTH=191 /DNA_ID=CAMNT_0019093799 /DNA_START=710 /DNA_END=1285 /DNA_ORIENTATION=+